MIKALKETAETPQEKGFSEALQKGFSIEDLDNKTAQELQHFYQHNTFKAIQPKEKHQNSLENDDAREACLNEIKTELNKQPLDIGTKEHRANPNQRIKPQ